MILPIVKYGSPVLRAKGRRIDNIDDRIRELAADMLDTMEAANGVGLAAQQVGKALLLTVMDVSQVEDRPSTLKLNGKEVDPAEAMPLILLNPALALAGDKIAASEGCLSFPDITADIERALGVRVEGQDLEGKSLEIEATGLLARVLQHEVDHLNGILFIDRMSSAAKVAVASKLKRLEKETKSAR